MRKLLVLTVAILAVMGGGTGTKRAEAIAVPQVRQTHCIGIHQGINFYRYQTHQFQNSLGATPTRVSKSPIRSCTYARWVADLWRNRAKTWHTQYTRYITRHEQGWECIHSREGSWDSNTGNGYYGGLQMHSGWGGVEYANLLSREQQIALAERVASEHNFNSDWMTGQWPNTYPPCAGYF